MEVGLLCLHQSEGFSDKKKKSPSIEESVINGYKHSSLCMPWSMRWWVFQTQWHNVTRPQLLRSSHIRFLQCLLPGSPQILNRLLSPTSPHTWSSHTSHITKDFNCDTPSSLQPLSLSVVNGNGFVICLYTN